MKLKKSEYYLLIYFILTLGIIFTRGFYSVSGLLIILISYLLLNFPFKFPNHKENNFPFLFLILISSIILSIFIAGGIYEENYLPVLFYKATYLLAFLVTFLYLLNINKSAISKYYFIILVILAILPRILIIFASPKPAIDAFYILKEAPKSLILGKNPYQVSYTKVYKNFEPNYFAYWPGAFLTVAPIIYLFNDPRYLFVLAEIFTAFLMYSFRKDLAGELLTLIFLFNPSSLFVIEQSWLNPLNTFLITLLFFLISKKKRIDWIFGLISGLLFSLQFHFFLLFLLLSKFLSFSRKYLISFLLTSLLIILPFFLWSPSDFIYDTIITWIKKPSVVPIPFHQSLNINSVFFRLTGQDIPNIILGAIFLGLFCFYLLQLKVGKTDDLLRKITLVFFSLFLFGTQAFINYYYFLGNLILFLSLRE